MRKSTSVMTIVTLAMTALAACSSAPVESANPGSALDPESEAISNGAFSPDPFQPESEAADDIRTGGTAAADVLAKVELANGGSVTFLNEAPSSEIPSISVVAVEPAGPSVMELIGKNSASGLELFRAIAPAGMSEPEALKVEHEARYAERGISFEPRALPITTLTADATVDDDPWGPDCDNAANWASGFNSWSLTASGRQHVGYVTPDPADDTYGYFGTYDQIWAGVCFYKYGVSINTVVMQLWDGSSYQNIAGTYKWASTKQRYRYYSYSPGTAARRIKVLAAGGSYQAKFLLSGAWAEPTIGL